MCVLKPASALPLQGPRFIQVSSFLSRWSKSFSVQSTGPDALRSGCLSFVFIHLYPTCQTLAFAHFQPLGPSETAFASSDEEHLYYGRLTRRFSMIIWSGERKFLIVAPTAFARYIVFGLNKTGSCFKETPWWEDARITCICPPPPPDLWHQWQAGVSCEWVHVFNGKGTDSGLGLDHQWRTNQRFCSNCGLLWIRG